MLVACGQTCAAQGRMTTHITQSRLSRLDPRVPPCCQMTDGRAGRIDKGTPHLRVRASMTTGSLSKGIADLSTCPAGKRASSGQGSMTFKVHTYSYTSAFLNFRTRSKYWLHCHVSLH
ncbi:hypothetical protein K466DRAFT_401469 [Polyporus arcularius HHB13444]|uniref:Uncharacterized protein n=1 Tax=Polyporus arcularius HHB13444 TaxID=1314778 RepID=A0A5C3P2L2_9APHY|nr:hypothetical protein K466DRAFT_401469 [Polyporus arcularius HHB13444]